MTSHDPRTPNFSVNTAIHESLLICRRHTPGERGRATVFVSLNRMPRDAAEVEDWVAAVHAGRQHRLHRVFKWPRERVAEGGTADAAA